MDHASKLTELEAGALNKNSESLNAISARRQALAKIGKFSAYVVPATIAIISSKVSAGRS